MKPLKSTLNNYLAESYLKLEKQLKGNNLSLASVLLLQDRLRTAPPGTSSVVTSVGNQLMQLFHIIVQTPHIPRDDGRNRLPFSCE